MNSQDDVHKAAHTSIAREYIGRSISIHADRSQKDRKKRCMNSRDDARKERIAGVTVVFVLTVLIWTAMGTIALLMWSVKYFFLSA